MGQLFGGQPQSRLHPLGNLSDQLRQVDNFFGLVHADDFRRSGGRKKMRGEREGVLCAAPGRKRCRAGRKDRAGKSPKKMGTKQFCALGFVRSFFGYLPDFR